MSRLWDKGAPLDSRVLQYTAGEDYALDERLVPYDVRASIAHTEMLHRQRLLSDEDLGAVRGGLTALADSLSHPLSLPGVSSTICRCSHADELLSLSTVSRLGLQVSR